eukprot:TRINITY_DN224_c2_g1_i3.p1 TRINITY_DN224_c2_g1~~TRINITY_DN224_c2_g1_i3.p1  ORF type:complete len:193 (+),score=32.61 TRINITY_DN224_c2_g1_i3:40-579(+)
MRRGVHLSKNRKSSISNLLKYLKNNEDDDSKTASSTHVRGHRKNKSQSDIFDVSILDEELMDFVDEVENKIKNNNRSDNNNNNNNIEEEEIKFFTQMVPDELWVIILLNLTSKDLSSVSRVNKHLNFLCSDQGLWKKVIATDFGYYTLMKYSKTNKTGKMSWRQCAMVEHFMGKNINFF